MSLGLKSHKLDFEILPTSNPKTLLFMDASEYMDQPDRPLLEVTFPGHTKYFLVNVAASKINTFNSNTLGYSERFDTNCLVELPDGVYTLKFKVCPYDQVFLQKYHLRTVQLRRDLRKLLTNLNCDISESMSRDIVDLMLLIETAEANAEENYARKASDQYQEAVVKLESLLNKVLNFC